MYKYKSAKFGDFTKYTFYNDKTGNSFSIVPEYGASLLEVNFDGHSMLDSLQTNGELLKNDWYKNIILYPFPNRLKNGKYNFEGKKYQFPINDLNTKNALHGFEAKDFFEIVSIDCSEKSAEIHCRHQNKGDNPAYPFTFLLDVKMCLSEENKFTIELILKNEGQQKIPVGLGWHPYFNCFGKSNDAYLEIPDCQFIEVDEFAIPTHEQFEYSYFQKKKKIGNVVLDNAFELKNQKEKAVFNLFTKLGKLTYWQETGHRKFNYVQIFTPSHRKSIAIEPMTCNIDAFNSKEGLITLEQEEHCSGKFGFTFQAMES